MDAEAPEPEARDQAGGNAPPVTKLQRVIAAIALLALLASAAISSWWILNDRVDFVEALGGRPRATESPPAAPPTAQP